MHKKSLDENLGAEQFNKKLFTQSMQMVAKCKKVPVGLVSDHHKNEKVKARYIAIESKLNNIMKMLGRFTQAEKPPLGDSLDFGVEIL